MVDILLDLISQLAQELNISAKGIASVIKLLNDGNTVPFIARYRKEATGNLDEVQIRSIQERHAYLLEMEERRQTILTSIESQGKLNEALRAQILACTTKNALEDLYLPYKPKRRTRASIAREKGLEPLALLILEQSIQGLPDQAALAFVDASKEIHSIEEALSGARDIAAEIISENADIRRIVRETFAEEGVVVSQVVEGKNAVPTKFEQYYDYKEKVSTIPSHRYLAIKRGEKEGILQFYIEIEADAVLEQMRSNLKKNPRSPFAEQLELALLDSYKRLITPSVETDMRVDLKLNSDRAAVNVFAENLRNLLMASPLGVRSVIGVDPGLRTGCKCTAVDATGKFLEAITIYPHQSGRQVVQAGHDFLELILKHKPFAIGVGNGTAGRETEAFIRQLLKEAKLEQMIVIQVSEAGASVYSASDIAREEFPDLDVTIRGAISIARRLQDPLAELVKVDPKAIGVGQYQHDVYQPLLHEKLSEVVESCVNQVGVEVNTASASLLSYVAGIGPSLALKIVKHRDNHGAFNSRRELLEVSGMGPRTFEQAAGFLRIRGGAHPLDSSAVHPERYELVELMAQNLGAPISQLIADAELVNRIDLKKYINEKVGELTLNDIIAELKKPGRDPRAMFEKPCFRDDVLTMQDLKIGMKLEGIVTNVTAFGAFVDIGVHQDGLIHISELTDRFIKDPAEVVRVGDKIKVVVLNIDLERKRISLSAKLQNSNQNLNSSNSSQSKNQGQGKNQNQKRKESFNSNPFAGL